jgi:pseudaminic acid biosynthesis-associated methylase
MTEPTDVPETSRLESMWAGDFGTAYVERNLVEVPERGPFWNGVLDRFPSRNVLEIGCAHGENLRHIARRLPPHEVWGADLNSAALAAVPGVAPGTNAVWALARNLPFRDRYFDLVFTVGLLIHMPEDTLPLVMAEIVRTSRRWILCGEYHADETTDINYRDTPGVLFKRDYGGLYRRLFPELVLREEGYLERDQGFDRVTYQIFERTD